MLVRALVGVSLFVGFISPLYAQSNRRACGFGFWQPGEECRRADGEVCKMIGYAIGGKLQTQCTGRRVGATLPEGASMRPIGGCGGTGTPEHRITACSQFLRS